MEDHQPEHYFRRVSKSRGRVSAHAYSDESGGWIMVGCLEVRGAVRFIALAFAKVVSQRMRSFSLLKRGVPKAKHVIFNSIL